jgi:hypothetical protein
MDTKRRIARDGQAYTRVEFYRFYEENWLARWQEASPTSAGAPQPANMDTTSRGAPESQQVQIIVGSFNFGFQQSMMTAKPETSQKHCANFARLCAIMVEAGHLDILFGSEVGDFGMGFSKAGISVLDVLQNSFGKQNMCVNELHNYVAMWGFGGASQPVVESPHGPPEIYVLPITHEIHAMITRFDVVARDGASQPAKVHVVAGNMHIVCGTRPPTITTRQRAVKLLSQNLETHAAPEPSVPVVRIIVGDDNLSAVEARQALQRVKEADPLWEVHATLAGGSGDHMAVNGATADFMPIAVGSSFEDRGMRNDQHDVVAFALRVRGASQPTDMDASSTAGSEVPKQEPAEFSLLRPCPLARHLQRVKEAGDKMRQMWEEQYDVVYVPKIISPLSRVLPSKRKRDSLS